MMATPLIGTLVNAPPNQLAIGPMNRYWCVYTTWTRLAVIGGPEGIAIGNAISMVTIGLPVAPHVVDLAAAEAGATAPLAELMPRLRAGGVAAVSTNGVLGDPAGASAEEGRELLRDLVADLCAAYDEWRA